MKRAWHEDPVYAAEIESAMKVAAVMFDSDEDVDDWERNFPSDMEADCGLEKGCDGDDDNDDDDDDDEEDEEKEKDDDEELDADYVKKNFDRLYVQKVVGWIEDGKNVFITGSPGRGKSTCVGKVIKELYGKGVRLVATGSTGVAAVNIGYDALEELLNAVNRELLSGEMERILSPTTVHSAFGLRKMECGWLNEHRQNEQGIESFMRLYVKHHSRFRSSFLKSQRSLSCANVPKIAHASLVILDEVSMTDGLLVEALDAVGRFWHPETDRPFGGIGMVFVGDFQQLPPVNSGTRKNPNFLFDKKKWTTPTSKGGWIDHVLQLKVNIRQEGDLEYGKLIDRMAMNALLDEDIELLQACVMRANSCNRGLSLAMNPYIMPFVPRIFTNKDHIAQYTRRVLEEVGEETKITLSAREEYEPSKDKICLAYGKNKVQGKIDQFISKLTEDCDAELFIGCPVRFLENKSLEEGVVNGAIAKLVGVAEKGGHPIFELKSGNQYTLPRSSSTIYLDDYTPRQRREIDVGRMRPLPGRPVAKFTYKHYRVKMALAMTPYAVQGCTLDTAIVHPNVDFKNEYTTIEALLVSLSRLRSSGIHSPGRKETIRAIPKPTLSLNTSDDGTPQPRGLYLTRFVPFDYYVNPKVRSYLDNIKERHSLLQNHGKDEPEGDVRLR